MEQINKEEAKMLDEIFMQELKKEQQEERKLRKLLERMMRDRYGDRYRNGSGSGDCEGV